MALGGWLPFASMPGVALGDLSIVKTHWPAGAWPANGAVGFVLLTGKLSVVRLNVIIAVSDTLDGVRLPGAFACESSFTRGNLGDGEVEWEPRRGFGFGQRDL